MNRSNPDLLQEFAGNPVLVEAHRTMMLDEIDRTIRMAEIRCLPFDDILRRIEHLWDDDAAGEIVYRACSEPLSQNQLCALAESVSRLAETVEGLPSTLKAKLDRAIKRILSRMPAEVAVPIAEPWLEHKRKFRREVAYHILRECGLTAESGARLLDIFWRTGDQECLKLVARNPLALSSVDARIVLDHVEDAYWRMRVIQAVLTVDVERGRSLGVEYPYEFAWAAGRLKEASVLFDLRQLFASNSSDLRFVSIYAWSLGQLGARQDLVDLRESLETGSRQQA